jgi:hypothetical protein
LGAHLDDERGLGPERVREEGDRTLRRQRSERVPLAE